MLGKNHLVFKGKNIIKKLSRYIAYIFPMNIYFIERELVII